METSSVAQLNERTGGLSDTSKMPGYSWGISAFSCVTGSKLRDVDGSVCSHCFARKGRYLFKNVRPALDRRLDLYHRNLEWIEDMVELIGQKETSGYFRWFDSGDLQSAGMLLDIMDVCRRLRHIKFWLPTREVAFVREAFEMLGEEPAPSNLTIRLSATMIDGPAPTELARRLGVRTSGVVTKDATCPAPRQGGVCGDCRACWDSKRHVTYTLH